MTVLRSFRLFVFTIYIAFFLSTTPANADATVSIANQPAYSRLRPCAQPCIWCGEYWLINCPGGAVGINNALTCNGLDSCFCRTDLQGSAASYLTTCINSQCNTNDVDVSAGVSLYDGYCGVDGATLDNYPTTGTAAVGTTTLTATPGGTPTVVVYSTVLAGSSTVVTSTSKWTLRIAVALAFAAASGVDLFG